MKKETNSWRVFYRNYNLCQSDYKMSEKDEEDLLWWAEKISETGILIGGSATLEHKLHHGRWHDEGKTVCHGGIGLWLFFGSLFARGVCAIIRASRPNCPYCKASLIHVFQEQRFYCNNCQQYIDQNL